MNLFRRLCRFYRNWLPEPIQNIFMPFFQTILFARMAALLHRQKKTKLDYVEVSITDHCNLNCKSCGQFSPLAPEKYIDPVEFERDFRRLYELTGGDIDAIRLLGGEPLLHPGITGLMKTAREIFDASAIVLVTNGILLLKQDESFWETCASHRINILISRYPVHINDDEIAQMAGKHGITVEYTAYKPQFMFQWAFDVTGKQNAGTNFNKCWLGGGCIHIDNGKLYSCAYVSAIKFFNNYYHEHLNVTDKDFLDVYRVKDISEILEFLSNPIPFCRYCDLKRVKYGQKWERSKKEKSEWGC